MLRQVPKSVRAITLDAAGTLFEPAESVGETYSRIGKAHGVEATPEALDRGFRNTWRHTPRPHVAGPEDEVAWWRRIAFGAFAEAGARGLDEAHFDTLYRELFHEYEKAEAWRLYSDTVPFLTWCRNQRWRVAALSNFDDRLVTILGALGLADFFDTIITSAQAKVSKPDRRIFELAANRLDLDPSQILHIGDEREADWEGARAAGFLVYELGRPTQDFNTLMVPS